MKQIVRNVAAVAGIISTLVVIAQIILTEEALSTALLWGIGVGIASIPVVLGSQMALKRKPSDERGIIGNAPRPVPRYPRWNKTAPYVLSIYVLLLVTGAGGWMGYERYLNVRPPNNVIILVANFVEPEQGNYRVTETVLNRLRMALAPYGDVEVVGLDRAITEVEGSEKARTEGEQRKATIVIWGWLGDTGEVAPLSVNFEVLRAPQHMPAFRAEAQGLVRTVSITELRSFTLQTQLSQEMTFLSLFTLGMVRYSTADWGVAITLFSEALDAGPAFTPVLGLDSVFFHRALAFYHNGDFKSSISDYDQVINIRPATPCVHYNRGLAYSALGDYYRAILDFDDVTRLDPEFTTAYYSRGNAYSELGQFRQAISDYDRAIVLSLGAAPQPYNNRGKAYHGLGEFRRAISDWDQAIWIYPKHAYAYFNRGRTFHELGEYQRAILDYDKAIRIYPEYAKAYFNRGVAYGDLGDAVTAQRDFARAKELGISY